MHLTPLRAIQKQHIRSFRHIHPDPGEILTDEVYCRFLIVRNHFTQRIQPLCALLTVCTHQCMHGQDIHVIVMRHRCFAADSVPQISIINNMIRSYKSCQVKGFAGRIQRNGPIPCVLRNGLCWDVMITGKRQIRPDLIRYDIHIMAGENLHSFFDFPGLPNTSRRIMRRAKNCRMDMVFYDLPFHVFIIHSPNALCIPLQWIQHAFPAIVLKAVRKADIRWRLNQNRISV